MKKLFTTVVILISLLSCNISAQEYFDPLVPKINHGTLTEVNFDDLPTLLHMSMDEITTPSKNEQTATGTIYIYENYGEKITPYKAYVQTVDGTNIEVYRVIFKLLKSPKDPERYYGYEKIFYKKKNGNFSLCYEDGMFWTDAGGYITTYLLSPMLIIKDGMVSGIFLTKEGFNCLEPEEFMKPVKNMQKLLETRDFSDLEDAESYDKKKPYNMAFVYFFTNNRDQVTSDWREDIFITASNPLIDAHDPLRYTIQNAFDQNPATSFVEDTDDDLMEIDCYPSENYISESKLLVTEVKLINGYAANNGLYNSNNRIKSIKSILSQENSKGIIYTINNLRFEYKGESDINFIPKKSQYGLGLTHILHIPFNDNTLDYQHLYISNYLVGKIFPIAVSSIYSGSKYNDTCIAELDIKYSDTWLFGGKDE
jgi:hypothetical protein